MLADTEVRTLTLAAPHRAAHGSATERTTVLLRLELDGLVGWGEAAPLASYDGGDLSVCREAIERACSMLVDGDIADARGAVDRLPADCPPQARAAVSTALLDLSARSKGIPLWKQLEPSAAEPVRLSRLVERGAWDSIHAAVHRGRLDGFTAFKLKLGLGDDADAARAVRAAAGEDATVIGDANGAWDRAEAEHAIRELGAGAVDWIEQPVRGIEAMRSLGPHPDVHLALDEDATDPGAFSPPPCAEAACLKLQAWGGPDRLIEAARAARSAGLKVYLGSTFEGPVGIAAGLHCAAAIAPDLPSGLATLDSFEQRFPGVAISGGAWLPTDRPGLGVDPQGNPA